MAEPYDLTPIPRKKLKKIQKKLKEKVVVLMTILKRITTDQYNGCKEKECQSQDGETQVPIWWTDSRW